LADATSVRGSEAEIPAQFAYMGGALEWLRYGE
jgi:hypothetical protein